MNKNSDSPAPAGDPVSKVPGRTTGFVIMSVVIIFVAMFMQNQSHVLDESGPAQAQTADPDLQGFRADAWYLADDPLLGFVEVPAGTFTMGSNPALDRMAYENERWSNLQRQGEVALPVYYIARFETTHAQFNAFVRDTGLAQESVDPAVPGDYPVTNVTWPDALAYTRWLEQQLRSSSSTPAALRSLLDNGGHVTLPNEAEWEKAARSTDGRIFPWGSRPRTGLANFGGDSLVPVGSIACDECAYGLSDMAGNAWELTRSPMRDYPFNPDANLALRGEPLFVMRGGSFSGGLNNVRTAVRGAVDPGVRNPGIGFRVAISTL